MMIPEHQTINSDNSETEQTKYDVFKLKITFYESTVL